MMNFSSVKGVLFDYGGTIDSNGVHWSEVIWMAYQKVRIPVVKSVFREAYIHGERTLGKNPVVKPHHTFRDMLEYKVNIQFIWLKENVFLADSYTVEPVKKEIVDFCYQYAKQSTAKASPVIKRLASGFPLVLVSNFYGNIATVLNDFHLDRFFSVIIESAVVGVRKPDPRIFELGVEALGLYPEEIVVVGDSYDKDIVPARSVGCRTIWLKGPGWDEYTGDESADATIENFPELLSFLHIKKA